LPLAQMHMSTLLLDAGELGPARKLLDTALASGNPDIRPALLMLLGELLVREQDWQEAEAAYQALIATEDPHTTAPAQIDLARLRQRRGDKAGAQDLLEEATASEDPEIAAEARGLLAISRWLDCAPQWTASATYLAERHSELSGAAALAALKDACNRNPSDAMLWLHLGLLMMGDQAADAYATATTGEPDPFEQAQELLAEGHLNRALAWAHVARSHDASTGALLQARVLLKLEEPDQAAVALDTATENADRGLLPQILTVYEDVLRAQPRNPWRYEEYASALERAGQIPAAVAAYDQAIALAPQEASHHFNKGWFLFAHGRFREARSECLEVMQLRADDVLGARVLLAAIAWPDDPEIAREHLSAAISSPGERLDPHSRALFRALALAGTDHLDEALAELRTDTSTDSDDTILDQAERQLLRRFQNPPLPGLDQILPLLDTSNEIQ